MKPLSLKDLLTLFGLLIGSVLIVAFATIPILRTFWNGHAELSAIRTVVDSLNHDYNVVVCEALETHSQDQTDYSRLVQAQDRLRSNSLELKAWKFRLPTEQQTSLAKAMIECERALGEVFDNVERFKTLNSAYRNSLRYLPTAADDLTASLPAEDRELKAHVSEILVLTLVNNLQPTTGGGEIAKLIDEFALKCKDQSPEVQDLVMLFARHAKNAVMLQPQTAQALSLISQSAYVDYLRGVSAAVSVLNSKSHRHQGSFVHGLSIFIGALLGFLGVLFWQLRSASRALHEANRTLEERFEKRSAELKAANEQLSQAQKLESIGQLAAGLAHEINTPMQYINDNIEYLRDCTQGLFMLTETCSLNLNSSNGEKPWHVRQGEMARLVEQSRFDFMRKQVPQAIEESLEGIDRVISIVRAMKVFSHPGTAEKVSTDINSALQSTVTISRNRWKDCAKLVMELDENLPDVKTLPSELNQVFLNLVVNASDAIVTRLGETSGKMGLITIRTYSEPGFVVIEVEDTGCGIPDQLRDRIYDPFFTTKGVGKGTGQGLAISHDIVVNKHGGRLEMESDLAVGTKFTIRLPSVPAPQSINDVTQNRHPAELIST